MLDVGQKSGRKRQRRVVAMLIERESVQRQWRAQIGSELRDRRRSSLGGLAVEATRGSCWSCLGSRGGSKALDARSYSRVLRVSVQRSGSRRGTAIYL